MSDFESPASTPLEQEYAPNPKRRKIQREVSTPRDTSSDELLNIPIKKVMKAGQVSSREDTHSPAGSNSPYYAQEYPGRTPLDEPTPDSRSITPSPRELSQTPNEVEQNSSHEQLSSFNARPRPRRIKYKQYKVLQAHRKGVAQVKFSPDGKWIASCSADATIKVWDADTGKVLHTMEGHLAGVSTIAWSPDSKTLASGSDDKAIRLWNRITGKPYPRPLLGHHNYVYSVAFSPKGNMIASGSYDEAVLLWDVRAGKQIKSLPAHSDPVSGIDFVRDGTLVASCSTDGLIRIWDTATGQCLRTIVHEDNAPVTAVKFSPNGRFVLAWTLDSCMRLWDYVEGRCLKTYQSHTNVKFSILGAFGITAGKETVGRDGKKQMLNQQAFIVSGSEDGDILLWDVKSKEVLQRIEAAHKGVVFGVAVNDRGIGDKRNMLASCGADGKVVLWKYEEEEVEEVNGGEEEPESTNGDANGEYPSGNDGDVGENGYRNANGTVDTPSADTPQVKEEYATDNDLMAMDQTE